MVTNLIVSFFSFSFFLPILLAILSSVPPTISSNGFSIGETTVRDLQLAFKYNRLTSRKLVEFYLEEIQRLNPVLHGITEVNPDALDLADKADQERKTKAPESLSRLHGIPIVLKDNIATKDKMNSTAGSFALLGSVVPRDAGVVFRLRKAGAIILGRASMTEWSFFRSSTAPLGWSPRGGQGKNPYTLGNPCGSSSGSAISVAANMAALSLGVETDDSILCPSSKNSVVGIKPTVGLTSRAGVVAVSPRQDTVGPICRTVSDAAYVLDAIAGVDIHDHATIEASKYIPKGGYAQFLRIDGLRGKRLGVVRDFDNLLYLTPGSEIASKETFRQHLNTLRQRGAVLVDNLKLDNITELYFTDYGEQVALRAEFKLSLNAYLKELIASPVRSLADVIEFNKKNPVLEKIEYGQDIMLQAQATNGIGKTEKAALEKLERLTKNGFVQFMNKNKLDALVTPGDITARILAIGGFPGISVPAGYSKDGPFGICFGGLKGSEPKLIEIAYGFEQATKMRKPPPYKKLKL
ncbi:Amidase [Quillaja saponaria]|uniref:Amidase n=1 Tax=Quillaja saponaria TaxID=32244 RepID=A0AAD7QBP8_QUISA|nr:Amidase [Quillaja saponaria]